MDHLSLFATPISVFDLALDPAFDHALRGELCERLTAEAQATPGVRRSNVGGWHSTPDLALRREPCFQAPIGAVINQVGGVMQRLAAEQGHPIPPLRYAVQAWAMVMRDGHYTIAHEHGDAHWSAVYYADAGDPPTADHPDSGLLAFVDPRQGRRPMPLIEMAGSTFSVRPRTGMLVLFPGWLLHYVHAYRGQRPRIAISCNVNLEPAPRQG